MNYEKLSDIELSKELIRAAGGALPCDTASVCCAVSEKIKVSKEILELALALSHSCSNANADVNKG